MLILFFSCGSHTSSTSETIKIADSAIEIPIDWDRGNPKLLPQEKSIRGIVHLHSHYSHDACDGNPQPDGIPDENCLEDLREALCEVRIDAAFLSDHPTHSTEVASFDDLYLHREGDDWLWEGNEHIANQINCENGHKVWIFPGVESADMMPLGLRKHIDGDYNGSTEAVDAVLEQQAINWIAHTEQVSVETILLQSIEGIEIYQLHANLDPDIRREYLGVDPFGYVSFISPFFFPTSDMSDVPESDLAFLTFVLPNEPAIRVLEEAGMQKALGISAGTDAHQNVFPNLAPDGERIDSYRRMMKWFNTRIVVDENASPLDVHNALKQRKSWVVMEVFGTPKNFSMELHTETKTLPMGSELSLEVGMILQTSIPTLTDTSPQGDIHPNFEGRLYHYNGEQRNLVHTWNEGELNWKIEMTGIYRVEIWIQPLHLQPYLGAYQEYAENWVPWIYTGAFFIR